MNKLRNLIMGIVAGLAGVALAQPAFAEVTVGGFMTQTVGFGDYKGGSEASTQVHFDTNAEILFTATGQTDGGLKLTARVELEGHSETGDHIDENWLSVEGNFGRITLGGEDPAVITHGYVGIAGGYGTMGYYDDTDSFTPAGGSIFPVGYLDAQGIRYATPKLGRFSGAVSYQPEDVDGPRSTSTSNNNSLLSVAGNYTIGTGTMNITVGGGVLSTTFSSRSGRSDNARNQWGAGAELEFGANTIYLRGDVWDWYGPDDNNKAWGVALERQFGKTVAGIGFARKSEAAGTYSIVENSIESIAVVDREYQSVVLGAKRNLGGGTSAGAAIAWGELDSDSNARDEDSVSLGMHVAFNF